MDGCKNVSISHTLPGGRYASVADSQCGQLGEFHTNLVNWTQLTVEKINSYFTTVVYKKKFHKMHVHHIAGGVSTASPAIAISSDTFNCPCFVDCSSTCDTGPVLCVVTRTCGQQGTVQQPGWCWYQHNLIPRQSPPSSWTRQHQLGWTTD